MPTYRELLAQLRAEIDEVDAVRARELLAADEPPLLVDIREFDDRSMTPGEPYRSPYFAQLV